MMLLTVRVSIDVVDVNVNNNVWEEVAVVDSVYNKSMLRFDNCEYYFWLCFKWCSVDESYVGIVVGYDINSDFLVAFVVLVYDDDEVAIIVMLVL